MKKISLLLCLVLASGMQSPDRPPSDDILTRDSDEHVISLEERKQTVEILLTAAESARNNGDALNAARFLNRIGSLQLLLTKPNDALTTYQEALDVIKDQDAATKIKSLNGMAGAYTYLRQCVNARPFLDQSIELSEHTHNIAGKAQAYLTLSDCQNDENQLLALNTAQEALGLWQSIGNKWGIGKTYSAIGYYQLTLQRLSESAESHQAALSIWRELKIPHEEAQALINLGFVEYRKGEWQNAISFFSQAQGLLDPKAYPFEMGQITITVGQIFIETGLTDAAILNLQQATTYFTQSEDPLGIAVVSIDLGKAYNQAERYTEAIDTLHKCIADLEKQPGLAAMCHEALGQTYVALNDPTTAFVHFETAVDLFTKSARVMEAARARARMGQVYATQRKFREAENSYVTALNEFQKLSDRLNESATLFNLGKLKLETKDLASAEQYLRESIDVTENIRRTPTTSDLTAAFSATIHERYQRYIDCLMLMKKDADFATTAFQYSETERGRSLKELLQATQSNLIPGIDPQLAQKEQSLRQSLKVKENYKIKILSEKYDPKELVAVDAELNQLQQEYAQLLNTLNTQFPLHGRIQNPQSWDLRQIQEQVVADDNTVLLEYSIGADRSYVWAVTRNDIVSYQLASETEITKVAQKVYDLLKEPPNSAVEAELAHASSELSNLVLAPVSKSLDKRRVIIVADDVLNYIPFQMLPQPNKQERLIESHEIINAPSASILGELRQETARRQPAAKVLAAFGNPVFASNYNIAKAANSGALVPVLGTAGERWQHALRDIKVDGDRIDPTNIQPLLYTTRELENLRQIAGDQTLMVTGFDATRETLNNTDLTQYAILHFATHGVLDPKNPENSGLFLSMVNRDGQQQNGFVGLQDIYALRSRVDLVVLSACRTGLGKAVKGEGLIGVTRGFMNAGASSAVASLWSVDDEATAELMKQFYSNMLRDGMPPAAALRAAQNTIRKDPRWSSPYYWAAFTFQGDYDLNIKIAQGRSYRLLGIVAVALLLILLLGLYLWWRRSRLNKPLIP